MANKVLEILNNLLETVKPIGTAVATMVSEGASFLWKEIMLGLAALGENLVVLFVLVPIVGVIWVWDHHQATESLREERVEHSKKLAQLEKDNKFLGDRITCLRAKKCK